MSALIIPIALSFAGFLLAIATYQGIRRGGARFYTLEREAVLRRAMLKVTAVLEASPPSSPVKPMPRVAPTNLIST